MSLKTWVAYSPETLQLALESPCQSAGGLFLRIRKTKVERDPEGSKGKADDEAPVTEFALGTAWYGVLMPLVVLAVPLYDLVAVSLIRIAQGRSPLVGDQQHLSHRLVWLGLSKRAAVIVIWALSAATGVGGRGIRGRGRVVWGGAEDAINRRFGLAVVVVVAQAG